MLELQKNEGFTLQTLEDGFAAVNDQPQTSARLRNGDIISFGSAKIQFWLAAPRQRGLRAREGFVWAVARGRHRLPMRFDLPAAALIHPPDSRRHPPQPIFRGRGCAKG